MIDCEFDTLILSLVLIWIFYVFNFNLQLSDRILLLADNPYMGMIPRHTVLRNKNYRMLIINKNIILYRVFDDEKEVRIYNIFSQRQDYLQLLQGL